jgi:hypothetical protein
MEEFAGAGDWTAYGAELDALKADVASLLELAGE